MKARIMALIQNSDFEAARKLCKILCHRNDTDPEGWFLYGAICGQLNDFQMAVDCFTRTIAMRTDNPAVYYNLGVAQHRLEQYDAATQSLRQAIRINPNLVEAHQELGNVLCAQRQFDAAIECYSRVISMRPGSAATYFNLGNVHYECGNINAAIENYQTAIRLEPALFTGYYQLAICAGLQGRTDDEIAMYRRVLDFNPLHVDALNNLGLALKKTGHLEEAIACYRRAIAANPGYYKAHINLGLALQDAGRLNAAEASFNEAVRLGPDYAEGYYNLGGLLYFCNRLTEAEATYRKAIELNPRFQAAHLNLGNLLTRQGRHHEAIASFRKALEIDPEFTEAHGNILFTLNYLLDCTPENIWKEHMAFGHRTRERLGPCSTTCRNSHDPEKRLRIGYVSADLRMHATSHFLEPVLEKHRRDHHEIYCYASQTIVDDITLRFRSHADCWRDIHQLSDSAAAELIRQDGIDLLVDLSGHTHGGRLGIFARKPAPIQVTWLGYLNTSGLDTMDYRIVDAVACPPGMFERYHTEKLLYLPVHQWCYRPPSLAPEPGPLPALTQGHVTFGSIHNTAKITEPVLRAWMSVLAEVPRSRLLLVGNGLESRRQMIDALALQHAVEPGRIEYIPEQSFANYLALHHRIDINLDAFPYCGGTTTCHSLWMGVPVITLAGNSVISRGGASLLHAAGLDELITYSVEDYVSAAAGLAADSDHLGKLRAGLRERVRQSPLVNIEVYIQDLEDLYRHIWTVWCREQQHSSRP